MSSRKRSRHPDDIKESKSVPPMDQFIFDGIELDREYRLSMPNWWSEKQILNAYHGKSRDHPSQEEWFEIQNESLPETDVDSSWSDANSCDSDASDDEGSDYDDSDDDEEEEDDSDDDSFVVDDSTCDEGEETEDEGEDGIAILTPPPSKSEPLEPAVPEETGPRETIELDVVMGPTETIELSEVVGNTENEAPSRAVRESSSIDGSELHARIA